MASVVAELGRVGDFVWLCCRTAEGARCMGPVKAGVLALLSRCSKATAELEAMSGGKSRLYQKPSARAVCTASSGPDKLTPKETNRRA